MEKLFFPTFQTCGPNLADTEGNTPITIAAATECCSIVKALAKNGALIDHKNDEGRDALEIATAHHTSIPVDRPSWA